MTPRLRADQDVRLLKLAPELRERVAVIDQEILEMDRMLTPFRPAAAGGGNASIAEETHTGAGAAPVADDDATNLALIDRAQLRADQNARLQQLERELRERLAVIDQRILELDQILTPFGQGAIDMLARVKGFVEEVNLKHATPPSSATVGNLVLTRLAHEMISEAEKLKLPVDLTVQLMLLAELRGVRVEQPSNLYAVTRSVRVADE